MVTADRCRLRGRIAASVAIGWLLFAATAANPAVAQTCTAAVPRVLATSATTAVVDIRHAGDGRQFFVEQSGRIRVFQNGALLAADFLNLSGVVTAGDERGLLSLAFHPDYPATPWFFVLYTSRDTATADLGDVVIARYSVSPNPNVANTAARILLVVPHALAGNHNGGQLQFGPNDGYLYASIGDGGGGCDNTGLGCNAQREDSLLGKLLRIDVNRDTPPYYNIPPNNPFAAPGGARDEIWAKGLRNPFRFAFDRQTGDLWIGDVGQDSREEINRQPAASSGGENYGWKMLEGALCNPCSLSDCPGPVLPCTDARLTPPVHEYGRSIGWTVIGGYVYRGSAMPALRGCYVFADYGSGTVWAIDPAAPATRRTLLTGVDGLTTFGEDAAGELYAAIDGDVYALGPRPALVSAAAPPWFLLLAAALAALGAVMGASSRARRP